MYAGSHKRHSIAQDDAREPGDRSVRIRESATRGVDPAKPPREFAPYYLFWLRGVGDEAGLRPM
jgi:hypothetical protein